MYRAKLQDATGNLQGKFPANSRDLPAAHERAAFSLVQGKTPSRFVWWFQSRVSTA